MDTNNNAANGPERTVTITRVQGIEIAHMLKVRANEIARFSDQNRNNLPECVETALTREMRRIRGLADLLTHEEGVVVPDDHGG